MTFSRPITEDDLHGFVDYQLDPARRSEVQTYLDDHPEIAARIATFSRRREALRAAAAPLADEPIPVVEGGVGFGHIESLSTRARLRRGCRGDKRE